MTAKIDLIPLGMGTVFSFDKETKKLNLKKLFGLTCCFNGRPSDDTNSGLACICVDSMRLEMEQFEYEYEVRENEFIFTGKDKTGTVSYTGNWKFYPEYKIITCRYSVQNLSAESVTLRRALPRIVLSPGSYDVYSQLNRWGNEGVGSFQELNGADFVLQARAGRSSVGSTPFCMIRDTETNNAFALHVVPHGNWMIRIHSEVINNEAPVAVIEAGLSDNDLFMELAPGETLELPEILLQQSPAGKVEDLSAPLQKYLLDHVMPENLIAPPIIYNTWLYRFTDFTHEQLLEQLAAAKKVGCETFIVDAGWFGATTAWWRWVGDWREQPGAPFYGNMKGFADEVRAAGLKFGFWMEPERWVEGIPIREEHPEWFPEYSTRIDLTIPEAAEYFYSVLADNIRKFGAEYIKIDFNASVGYDRSGCEMYHYVSVLHSLMKRLKAEFPKLVIENCGSGALRMDLAVLTQYDQAFISDNANPYETLRIRQGAALRYLSSRILNWIVMQPITEQRLTPVSGNDLVLAAAAATWDECASFNLNYVMLSSMIGIPGFSGDLAAFSPEMLEKIAKYVKFYKENRKLFETSVAYTLTAPGPIIDFEKFIAWQIQSRDQETSFLFVFSNTNSHRSNRNFCLKGLDADAVYKVEKLFPENEENEVLTLSGKELMEYGMEADLEDHQHIRHAAVLYKVSLQK